MAVGRKLVEYPLYGVEPTGRTNPEGELADPRDLKAQNRAASPGREVARSVAPDLAGEMRRVRRLLTDLIVAQGNPPITGPEIPAIRDGSGVDPTGTYSLLFQNRRGHRIAIKVVMDAVTNGARTKLSFRNDQSDLYKVADVALSGVPPMGVESGWIVLQDNQAIYIALGVQPGGGFIAIGADDKFRILVHDPADYAG